MATNCTPLATRVYSHLIRLFPAPFNTEYGDEMLKTFDDWHRGKHHGPFLFWLEVSLDLTSSLPRAWLLEGMKTDHPAYRRAARLLIATAFILMLPLVAMQVTDQVAWDLADFAAAAGLLVGTGLVYELAARRVRSNTHRSALGAAIAFALILVWMHLAGATL